MTRRVADGRVAGAGTPGVTGTMAGVNPSTALATVLVTVLRDLGVRHAVLCPGSRSSALAYALAAADGDRLRLHVRVDERSAAFLALGLAKETGVPAVVVTTSGTAVANLHPAVLEASHAGVPLLVLSADRPHELRGTGANQTTDQVKLFGPAVRSFAEIPAPGPGGGWTDGWAAGLRARMSRVIAASLGLLTGDPGPVHVNVAFAEPLVPDGDDGIPGGAERDGAERGGAERGGAEKDGAGRGSAEVLGAGASFPVQERAGVTRVEAATPVPVVLPDAPGTVVLAGDGAGPDAAELATARGWPLLAEPSSGSRVVPAVGPYRLLIDLPGLGDRIRRVIVFGRPTLSRSVTGLLSRSGVEVVVVSARPTWSDPPGRAVRVVPAVATGQRSGSAAGPGAGRGGAEPGWAAAWHHAGEAAAAALDALLTREAERDGPLAGALVAREVLAALRPGQALVVGPSTAVRDLDLAGRPRPAGDGVRVLANRGLAGIDGVLSTASGVALARATDGAELPVRALVGDLTFVHDANGLLVGPAERRPHLQVVLLDDAGGGIFGLLEPGRLAGRGTASAAVFERVFATPTGTDLAALCAAHGVGYRDLGAAGTDTLTALRAGLADPPRGISVLRVGLDRSAGRGLAARVAAEVRAAAAGVLAGTGP